MFNIKGIFSILLIFVSTGCLNSEFGETAIEHVISKRQSAIIQYCTQNQNLCKNNGKCVMLAINLSYCLCVNGYTGSHCDIAPTTTRPTTTVKTTTSINSVLCPPGRCKNNGQCIVLGHLGFCACPPEFTGSFCQISLNAVTLATIPTATTQKPTTTTQKPTATTTTTLKPTTTTIKAVATTTVTTLKPPPLEIMAICPISVQTICMNGGTCLYSTRNNEIFCACSVFYTGPFCNILAIALG